MAKDSDSGGLRSRTVTVTPPRASAAGDGPGARAPAGACQHLAWLPLSATALVAAGGYLRDPE